MAAAYDILGTIYLLNKSSFCLAHIIRQYCIMKIVIILSFCYCSNSCFIMSDHQIFLVLRSTHLLTVSRLNKEETFRRNPLCVFFFRRSVILKTKCAQPSGTCIQFYTMYTACMLVTHLCLPSAPYLLRSCMHHSLPRTHFQLAPKTFQMCISTFKKCDLILSLRVIPQYKLIIMLALFKNYTSVIQKIIFEPSPFLIAGYNRMYCMRVVNWVLPTCSMIGWYECQSDEL